MEAWVRQHNWQGQRKTGSVRRRPGAAMRSMASSCARALTQLYLLEPRPDRKRAQNRPLTLKRLRYIVCWPEPAGAGCSDVWWGVERQREVQLLDSILFPCERAISAQEQGAAVGGGKMNVEHLHV